MYNSPAVPGSSLSINALTTRKSSSSDLQDCNHSSSSASSFICCCRASSASRVWRDFVSAASAALLASASSTSLRLALVTSEKVTTNPPDAMGRALVVTVRPDGSVRSNENGAALRKRSSALSAVACETSPRSTASARKSRRKRPSKMSPARSSRTSNIRSLCMRQLPEADQTRTPCSIELMTEEAKLVLASSCATVVAASSMASRAIRGSTSQTS